MKRNITCHLAIRYRCGSTTDCFSPYSRGHSRFTGRPTANLQRATIRDQEKGFSVRFLEHRTTAPVTKRRTRNSVTVRSDGRRMRRALHNFNRPRSHGVALGSRSRYDLRRGASSCANDDLSMRISAHGHVGRYSIPRHLINQMRRHADLRRMSQTNSCHPNRLRGQAQPPRGRSCYGCHGSSSRLRERTMAYRRRSRKTRNVHRRAIKKRDISKLRARKRARKALEPAKFLVETRILP